MGERGAVDAVLVLAVLILVGVVLLLSGQRF